MPPTTRRTSNAGVIRRWHGVVTADDQITSSDEIAGLVQQGPIRYIIVDYSDVSDFRPQRQDVVRIAHRMRDLAVGGRVAIIAIAPQDLIYGMVRMFDLSVADGSPWLIHVVRSADDAFAWLEEQLPDLDFSEARRLLREPDQAK